LYGPKKPLLEKTWKLPDIRERELSVHVRFWNKVGIAVAQKRGLAYD